MPETQPHDTAYQDEYPYWVSDGMDQGEDMLVRAPGLEPGTP